MVHVDPCLRLNVGQRRTFWTTRLNACGEYVLCAKQCGIAGLQYIDIPLTDVTPPVITSSASIIIPENTLLVHNLTASETVVWSIVGGVDASRFEISGKKLRWLGNGTKDYEAPNDADLNNIYMVTVRATDLVGHFVEQAISVTVIDVIDISSVSINLLENTVLNYTLSGPTIWSILGGADASKFELSGSTLRWVGNGTKDFEAPDDANADNVYVVIVGGNDVQRTISVTVLDVAEFVPFSFAFVGTGGDGSVTDCWGVSAISEHGVTWKNINTLITLPGV